MTNEQAQGHAAPLEFGIDKNGKTWYQFDGKPIAREDFIAVNLGSIAANLGALAEVAAKYMSYEEVEDEDDGEGEQTPPVTAKTSGLGDIFGTGGSAKK